MQDTIERVNKTLEEKDSYIMYAYGGKPFLYLVARHCLNANYFSLHVYLSRVSRLYNSIIGCNARLYLYMRGVTNGKWTRCARAGKINSAEKKSGIGNRGVYSIFHGVCRYCTYDIIMYLDIPLSNM